MSTDVKFINTTSSKLNDLSISNGQLIVLSDKSGMYYDMGGKRHSVGSTVQDVGSASEPIYIKAGVPTKCTGILTTSNWSNYITTIAVFG